MNKILIPTLMLTAGLLLVGTLPAAETSPPAAALPPSGVSQPAGGDPAVPEPAAEPGATRFETPDAAALALIEAAAADGSDLLLAVLGPDLAEMVSGDPVADAADREWFIENALLSAQIEDESSDSALLVIGPDDWPFPIPLAKDDQGWFFDTAAGLEELLNRRIGLNEIYTLAALRAFVEAQREYAAADPMGQGIPVFADRILSSEGRRDGLYWPTQPGEPASPLGHLVAEAVGAGYGASPSGQDPRPFHGYLYKILTAQGDQAPGGAMSYFKEGRLTQGVALLAWPASYGRSGIMTFLVNHKGMVYEQDLGVDTTALAAAIEAYDPGEGWRAAVD
ncbi:MAG: DUF2950 domain-containing protein [Chromatiaceae bacterium]|nr:DUF2950 domain-containing protein [Chromatiaceae bacterium]